MHRNRNHPAAPTAVCLVALLLVPFGALTLAQESPAPTVTKEPAAPCSAPEHRQFDFWIGSWRVTTADGKPAGRNRIEKILGGCVLRESWTGASGFRGESYNLYSARDGSWHQTWVDSGGQLLLLDGGLVEGAMVLTGTHPGPDGKPRRHRIRWQPREDGTVRQHWQVSADGGKSWRDLFDGIYHPEG